jgi:hypothetical protein
MQGMQAQAQEIPLQIAQAGATSAIATHVLPVAGQLERADVPHFIDQLQPAVVAQYTPAVVPLHADRRPMWWVFARLAAALGHDVLPGVDLAAATDDDALAPLMAQSRVPLAELAAHDRAMVSDSAVFGWANAMLRDGRWDLAPSPLVEQLARHHEVLITIEEGSLNGFGGLVMHHLALKGLLDHGLKFRPMTLPDIWIDHESPKKQYDLAGLNAPQIVDTVLKALKHNSAGIETGEEVRA